MKIIKNSINRNDTTMHKPQQQQVVICSQYGFLFYPLLLHKSFIIWYTGFSGKKVLDRVSIYPITVVRFPTAPWF